MANLQEAAKNFEEFSNIIYQFTVSCGKRFEDKKTVKLSFDLNDFAHALGLPHLTDVIATNLSTSDREIIIFQNAKQGAYPESRLQQSVFYNTKVSGTYNTQTQQGYSVKDRIEKLTDIVSIIDEACKGLALSEVSIKLYKWQEHDKPIIMPNGKLRNTAIKGMSYVFSIQSSANPDEKLYLFAYNTDYIDTKKQDVGVCVRSAFADCVDLTINQEMFPIMKVEKIEIEKNHQKTELYYNHDYRKEVEWHRRKTEIDNALNELRDEIKNMKSDDSGSEKVRKESNFLNYLEKFVNGFETEKECDYARSALVKRHDTAKAFQKQYYNHAIDRLDERISEIQQAESGKPKIINILPQRPVPISANGTNTLSLRSLLETIIPQSITITFHPNNHFFRRLGHEIRKAVDKFVMRFIKANKDTPPSDEASKDEPQSQLPEKAAPFETQNSPQTGLPELVNPSEISSQKPLQVCYDNVLQNIVLSEEKTYVPTQIFLPLSNAPELTVIVSSEERQPLSENSKSPPVVEQSHKRESKQIDFLDRD